MWVRGVGTVLEVPMVMKERDVGVVIGQVKAQDVGNEPLANEDT